MLNAYAYRALFALMAATWLGVATSAAAQEPVGTVQRLQGDALVTRADAETTQLLEPDAPVYLQDRIETLAGSRIELRFEDDTVVYLGAKSTLRITEFVLSQEGQRESAVLGLVAGIFRAVVSRLLPDAVFEVRTQQVVAAVRGTDWMAEAGDNTTSVVVLEGAVAVRRADAQVTLRAGEGVDARPGEPLRKKRWGQGRIDGMRERMFRHMASGGMMGMDPSRMREMGTDRMRTGRSPSP